MRESKFVQQNKEQWEKFETALKDKSSNPEELYHLFNQVTDDLSFSRTFYPNRSVKNYLNTIAQQSFFKIYTSIQNDKWKAFKNFWLKELPISIWTNRNSILMSLIIFVVAMFVGIISTAKSPEFARLILGNSYIEMTLENISKGDPMGVYKDENVFGMALGITVNNILVSFFAYILGILWGVGTVVLLIRNGIMLGCFQYFFYEKGLLKEMLLTIWLHGTLEISAIVFAGGAGLILAKGIIMPGNFTRIQAFRSSAKDGLTIMIGLIPLFIIAGGIESFITRHTELFWVIKLSLILISLFFILFVYIYFPYKISKNTTIENQNYQLHISKPFVLYFDQIKGYLQLISETFMIYSQHLKQNLTQLVMVGILFFLFLNFGVRDFDKIENEISTFSLIKDPYLVFNMLHQKILAIGIMAISSSYLFVKSIHFSETLSRKQTALKTVQNFPYLSIIWWIFAFIGIDFNFLFIFLIIPIVLFILVFINFNTFNLFENIVTGFRYLGKSVYSIGLRLFLFFNLLAYFSFVLYEKFLKDQLFTIISWHLEDADSDNLYLITKGNYFFSSLIIFLFWQLISISFYLLYRNSLEIHEATGLKNQLNIWKETAK